MIRTIIAIIGFVLAGGMFFFYTKPAYDGVQSTGAQIAQYDAALQKAAELQTLKQSLLSRYNAFAPTDLDRLQKLLPDHVDNVRLILDIDNLAGRYGLALQNVDVSSSDTETKSQTAVGAVGNTSQKYGALTLTFTTHGTYDNFIQFMTDLEESLRIVNLTALSMTVDSTPGLAASTAPVYVFNISLRTYWLK